MPGGFALAGGGVRARLTRTAIAVRAGAATWSLGLRAVGYGKRLHPVGARAPGAARNHVTYDRGWLDEWYSNGPLGLEQGFTLRRPPARAGRGLLTLDLGRLPRGSHLDGRGELSVPGLTYGGLYATDSRGRSLPARIERAGGSLQLRVDDRSARYPLVVDPFIQAARLTASDGAVDDNLGLSVAVSADGSTVVAGAPYATVGSNTTQGSAYVFTRSAAGWATATESAKLTASDGESGDNFGMSAAISGDGTTIVVGSPYRNVGATVSPGVAYVFVKPAGGWTTGTQTAELTASDGGGDDHLGSAGSVSVSDDGTTIAAGAPDHSNHLGQAYVFVRPGGGWADAIQTAKLTASDGVDGDGLGSAVALSGDGSTVVAGAPFRMISGNMFQGAAYVFVKPGGAWTDEVQDGELTASTGGFSDTLGSSLAISRDGATIASGADSAYVDSVQGVGAVYMFTRPGGGWVDADAVAKLTASDGAEFATLGTSVAMLPDGSAVFAGTPQAQIGNDADQGAAYLFVRPASGWASGNESAKLAASDGRTNEQFGRAVAAAAAGTLVSGAYNATVGANGGQGAVYAFVAPTTTTVSCQPAALTLGAATTCTTSVADGGGLAAAGATVTVTSDAGGGSCELSGGSCQVTFAPSAAGTHTITAAYGGDGGHQGSQATTSVSVTAPTGGGTGGGGGGGGTLLPPAVKLSSPARERLARTHVVTVRISSDTAATFVAHGTLSVPGAARVFKLRGATGALVAKTAKTIRLRLSSLQVKAVKRALRRHRTVKAHVAIRVRNGAGATIAARTIRARR